MVVAVGSASALAEAVISFSLSPAGLTEVPSGAVVTVDVRATFDTRLSAAAFDLRATGSSGATLLSRSANPTAPNGLSYVSILSQDPFDDGLPVSISAGPVKEVLFDNDFSNAPGGATDGLPPGNDVLIEQFTLRLSGAGSATVSISDVSAAHTTGPPAGSLFDIAGIGVPSVTYTVLAPCGDGDDDGDVDLRDWGILQDCFTGDGTPNANPDCDPMQCDADDDIDLNDYASFKLIVAGG